jgi:hypothetical protein
MNRGDNEAAARHPAGCRHTHTRITSRGREHSFFFPRAILLPRVRAHAGTQHLPLRMKPKTIEPAPLNETE